MKRIVALLMISIVGGMAAETSLWYDKPAQDWEREALPIGNGRLAAMLFGEDQGSPANQCTFKG